ncbi:related to Translation initiation factor eIF-2B subunit delta [Saccharomycodes ludwigii]|uniref:Translation initiation factor eIF2B subunit delta n=1 Tax=Saccharomycodes ludwigii TaxID=36035 RepID=A0A376B9W6_9ASCO|nr:hypothetical protein SCDLUD_000513 [Saccharomycodes ludwigii]KAH3902918.1 hypothetical protein SCDLUD_000513 [Saccharomycodes ludwigii]SSD61447.1 related to Translation initiation factor eIF-2B subunit delta [Saccharomycodes ludwigii]
MSEQNKSTLQEAQATDNIPPTDQSSKKTVKNGVPTKSDTVVNENKLSNKELKELKKKEKASKRAAKKAAASGITIEKQQQQAQLKKEKKQKQRELEKAKEANQKKKASKNNNNNALNKSSLFGHLETAAERRASLLAVSSVISSTKASKITATGLSLPSVVVITSKSGNANVAADLNTSATTTTTTTTAPATASSSGDSSIVNSASTTSAEKTLPVNVAGGNTIVTTEVNSDEENNANTPFSLEDLITPDSIGIPGTCSIIPDTIISEINTTTRLAQQVKDLIISRDLLHPSTLKLTDKISQYKIVGSIPRCLAMLETFKDIISDYSTPQGTTLSRNLTSYLSHQIDFIKKARPLSVTMGNAIRWIKQEISVIDPNTADKIAKKQLLDSIDQFINEKIELADQLIIENASQHIQNNTTIVTYGCSNVITKLLIHNKKEQNKNFKVIICDSRPLFEGRKCAKTLKENGVDVTYCMLNSLAYVFQTLDIDYVFMGAHSILSNGFSYSRVGSAMLAMTAKRKNVPVIVCCESLKFINRVQLDSLTMNELADPNDLISVNEDGHRRKNILLEKFIKEKKKQQEVENVAYSTTTAAGVTSKNNNKKNNKQIETASSTPRQGLEGWEEVPDLNIFNIMYDLTPPEYIKKIVTEFGALPPPSVPVILREYKGSV